MRNGTGTSFVKAPTLADNGLITKAYLRDMEAAVKQRTPIAGDNITIKVTDGGYVISSTAITNVFNNTIVQNTETGAITTAPPITPTPTSPTITSPIITSPVVTAFREITLNVCSNGVPGTIIVFGPVN
jgi:hypothetical protein